MAQLKRRRAVKGDSYYGKAAEMYEARRVKQDWWQVEHKQMKACLGNLPNKLNVLDVPFGTGRFLPIYRSRGDKVHGLDSSEDMISQALALRGKEFEGTETSIGSAMALPFDDDTFDLLVSVRFLSEIITFSDAKVALAEFARVTRTYAVLQLSERTVGTGLMPEEDAAMRDLMDRGQVNALLKDHGFDPIERYPVREGSDFQINHILCHVA